eukprot:scaffold1312_cov264-Pinguiococcus_pyrenoidosus.AAC.3
MASSSKIRVKYRGALVWHRDNDIFSATLCTKISRAEGWRDVQTLRLAQDGAKRSLYHSHMFQAAAIFSPVQKRRGDYARLPSFILIQERPRAYGSGFIKAYRTQTAAS